MHKFIKLIIGIIGLPIAILFILSFLYVLKEIQWFVFPNYLFVCGFFLYGLFFSVMKERSFAYVLGHEVMHALTAMLFGGKLVSIFVSQKNGSVKTTKDNFLISLSPYCVPFYACMLLFVYYLISIFARTAPYMPVFIFLLGYSLAHHIFFTVHYLKMGQSDLRKQGIFFSFAIILSINVLIIINLMNIFIGDIPIDTFWRSVSYGVNKVYLCRT